MCCFLKGATEVSETSSPEAVEIRVNEGQEGTRLDLVLSSELEELSRSFIQKLFEEGRIYVNGEPCVSKKYKAACGDIINVEIPVPEELSVEGEDLPLHIVYEDSDLLVINKPAGMVVHPAAGNWSGTLVNGLLHHCRGELSSINGRIRPGIVHRIDKDTSGLLVVAKNDMAHRGLSEQFAVHSITRVYKMIVWNNIKEDEGTVDAPIGRDPKNRLRNAVTDRGSRRAVTHYRVLERFGTFTYAEARLETGRTHQIRVHMSYIKHPLLGDGLYGPEKNRLGAGRQMLHAGVLGFCHPGDGRYMEFESSLPDDFAKVLETLRRKKEG